MPSSENLLPPRPDDSPDVTKIRSKGDDQSTFVPIPPKNDPGSQTARSSKTQALPESIDKFKITRQLGEGGFGLVYEGFDAGLNRRVAIKVPRKDRPLRPKEQKRFLQEGKTLAQIKHSSIVTVHQSGETKQGLPFVVMEYVDGENLASVLKRKSLSIKESLEMLLKIGGALKEAHRCKIIHRDLKPSNVIVDKKGGIHLVDFGLALHENLSIKEFAGAIAGTPSYMAPEQIRGENHRIKDQTDIWSFGVMMYQMLTHQLPFQGESSKELARAITYKNPKSPRQVNGKVPKEVERICLRCLAKQASKRYQNLTELTEDLNQAIIDVFYPQDRELPIGMESGVITGHSAEYIQSGVFAHGDSLASEHTHASRHWNLIAKPLPISYKGLRPFDSNDKDFFPRLLPGLRDRFGVPDSIRFWLNRIKGDDELGPMPVGVIYGPSGCGKSSFVRAGIIPLLPTTVNPIYLECTPDATERRLVRQLANEFHTVNGEDSLVEIFRQMRHGDHLEEGDQLVIFLDQFEQWLYTSSPFEKRELTEALLHCDGVNVVCVLLIRDDFWMSTSQFMETLDLPIREGHNALALPQFDLRHAKRILVSYGRAFGRLENSDVDEHGDTLSEDEKQFIDQAVNALAEDDKVVCVKLSVFAQIIKDRDWTAAELENLGGMQGVGIRFLDDILAEQANSPRAREFELVMKAVLRELIADRINVKGKSKTVDHLQTACGDTVSDDVFDQTVKRLESEYRLVSYVEDLESSSDQIDLDDEAPAEGRHLRLSHDFMVAPIREWLERKQKETRSGRAGQRLAELGDAWNTTKDRCFLPGILEYGAFRFYAVQPLQKQYQQFLQVGGQRVTKRLGAGLALLLIFASVIVSLFVSNRAKSQQNYRTKIENQVIAFLAAPLEPSQYLEDSIDVDDPVVEEILIEKLRENDPEKRLRAACLLLERNPQHERYSQVVAEAAKLVSTDELDRVAQSLAQDRLAKSSIKTLSKFALESDDVVKRVGMSFEVEAAREYVFSQVTNNINKAMRADASASKRRRNRKSFLSITLDVKGGRDAVLVPVAAAEPMKLSVTCDECDCRYSYVGAAYFCPGCGVNSASHTFSQTLTAIRTAAGLGKTLRDTLDPDEAEVMIRSLLEKAMQDTVMSFQRLCEQLYEQHNGSTPKQNAFQRLDTGSELWNAEIGTDYEQLVGNSGFEQLRVFFQQRHLLSHRQGIVDDEYIRRSGDNSLAVGQRLTISERSVRQFADLVERLANELMKKVG